MFDTYFNLWLTPSCEMTPLMNLTLYSPLIVGGLLGLLGLACLMWWERVMVYASRPTLRDIELLRDIMDGGFMNLSERDQAFLTLLHATVEWSDEQVKRFQHILNSIKAL